MSLRSTARRERRRRAGVTVLELAVLVAVIGTVLAAFVPTFLRQIRTSKLAEAADTLGALHRAAAAYYATRHGEETSCLPNAAGPAPRVPSPQPIAVDFSHADTPGADTWIALGFAPETPVRFSYSFLPARAGCALRGTDAPLLRLRAEGDLDGDGVRSTFERTAVRSREGALVPEGVLHAARRLE